jgi:3-phenylpropionate/trans-cinnamate dioxygenase ferredoxin reductase component
VRSHSKYLIVGGGMAALAAAEGIRDVDPVGPITIVGEEPDPPYNRPPLSKGLRKGGSIDDIWRGLPGRVDLCLGRRVQDLDSVHQRITDDHGAVLTFEQLLLATGASPRRFPFGEGASVIYFRTLSDYRRLRERSLPGRRVAVIGGGVIGSEIAAALTTSGVEVVMILPEAVIGSRLFPRPLADFVTARFRDRGVEVLSETVVKAIESRGEKVHVRFHTLAGEREISVDGVVAAIGVTPNVHLARLGGLRVENGIAVDEFLRTTQHRIYAAGDVASFFSPALEKRVRAEHEDNANRMGRLAGRNMAGSNERYQGLPFFHSDLFASGYEAVGETDSRLEMVMDWKDPYREGVVYYLREQRVRGVLLWNLWQNVEAARQLIYERRPFRPEELKGRLVAHRTRKGAETLTHAAAKVTDVERPTAS